MSCDGAKVHNLKTTRRGNTYLGISFTVTINDVVADLTGASVLLTFKKGSPEASSVALQLTELSGLTVTPSEGRVTVDPFIVTLDPGVYHYDLKITYSSGVVRTYFKGKWEISPNVG